MGAVCEGGGEEAEAVEDLLGGVDVERSPVGLSERGEVHAVAVEAAVTIGEGTDGGSGRAWLQGVRLQTVGVPVVWGKV